MEVIARPDGSGGWIIKIPHVQILALLSAAGVMWESTRRSSTEDLAELSRSVSAKVEEAKEQDRAEAGFEIKIGGLN